MAEKKYLAGRGLVIDRELESRRLEHLEILRHYHLICWLQLHSLWDNLR